MAAIKKRASDKVRRLDVYVFFETLEKVRRQARLSRISMSEVARNIIETHYEEASSNEAA